VRSHPPVPEALKGVVFFERGDEWIECDRGTVFQAPTTMGILLHQVDRYKGARLVIGSVARCAWLDLANELGTRGNALGSNQAINIMHQWRRWSLNEPWEG